MKTFKDLLGIFWLNSNIRIQRNMQYRFDFINGLVMALLNSSISVITLFLIFTTTNGYPNWTLPQIFLFQGMLLFWYGLKDILFGDVRDYIADLIRKGNFDRLLLKPYPSMGLILTAGPNYMSLSSLLAGIVIIILALSRLHICPSLTNLLAFFIFTLSAIIFYMAILVIYSIICLMIVVMGRISEIMDKVLSFGEYPMEIYNKGISFTLKYVFPLAVFAYLPSQSLLGRLDPICFIIFPICIILFLLALLLWQHCLNKYTSAGG